MAEVHAMYGICVPGRLFRDVPHVRHVTVQLRLNRGRTGFFISISISVVVRRFSATSVRGSLLRIQARAARVPDDHVQHPAGGAHAPALVPERLVHDDGGRYLTVRRVLRRALLYTIKYV